MLTSQSQRSYSFPTTAEHHQSAGFQCCSSHRAVLKIMFHVKNKNNHLLKSRKRFTKLKTRKKTYLPYQSHQSYEQMFIAVLESTETSRERIIRKHAKCLLKRMFCASASSLHVQHVAEPTVGT